MVKIMAQITDRTIRTLPVSTIKIQGNGGEMQHFKEILHPIKSLQLSGRALRLLANAADFVPGNKGMDRFNANADLAIAHAIFGNRLESKKFALRCEDMVFRAYEPVSASITRNGRLGKMNSTSSVPDYDLAFMHSRLAVVSAFLGEMGKAKDFITKAELLFSLVVEEKNLMRQNAVVQRSIENAKLLLAKVNNGRDLKLFVYITDPFGCGYAPKVFKSGVESAIEKSAPQMQAHVEALLKFPEGGTQYGKKDAPAIVEAAAITAAGLDDTLGAARMLNLAKSLDRQIEFTAQYHVANAWCGHFATHSRGHNSKSVLLVARSLIYSAIRDNLKYEYLNHE